MKFLDDTWAGIQAAWAAIAATQITVQTAKGPVVLSGATSSYRATTATQPLGPIEDYWGPSHFLARFEVGTRVFVHLDVDESKYCGGGYWECVEVLINPDPLVVEPDPRAIEAARVVSFDEFNMRRSGEG